MHLMTEQEYEHVYFNINKIDMNLFKGSVLFLGLGLCYMPPKCLTDDITIIEIDEDVIRQRKAEGKIKDSWTIVNADIWEYEPDRKYDLIFADIWYSSQPYEIIDKCIEKYSKYLKENGKILYLETIRLQQK